MDEFVGFTIQSRPGESEAEFSARLTQFWTHMLRQFQVEFEKVYAEASAFDDFGDRIARQYLVEPTVIPLLESETQKHSLEHLPVDHEDTYSKYEAVAPDWMQIEH